MRTNKASAKWNGNLKEGNGKINLSTSGQEFNFSFLSRFKDGKGTNPEELIAAAHAGCFSMAFSNILAEEGYTPDSVSTSAEVTIENVGDGFKITKSVLKTDAKVQGIDEKTFQKLAEKAKKGCPVSQALSSLEISLEAKLNS